jgi:hypothetical protein
MCADVEVRKGRVTFPACTSVADERLPGEEPGLVGKRQSQVVAPGQLEVEILDPLGIDGDLGIDDRVDRELIAVGGV